VGFSLHISNRGAAGGVKGESRVQPREPIGSLFGLVFRAIVRLGL